MERDFAKPSVVPRLWDRMEEDRERLCTLAIASENTCLDLNIFGLHVMQLINTGK